MWTNTVMKYEKFIDIISTQEYTADFTIGGSPTSLTWGRGIWYLAKAQAPDGVTPIGGKTGTTPEAGYCLSLLSEDASGTPYVASVVLKASGKENLYANMTALLSKVP